MTKRFLIDEEDLKIAIAGLEGFNLTLSKLKTKPKVTTKYWEECAERIEKQMTKVNSIHTET